MKLNWDSDNVFRLYPHTRTIGRRKCFPFFYFANNNKQKLKISLWHKRIRFVTGTTLENVFFFWTAKTASVKMWCCHLIVVIIFIMLCLGQYPSSNLECQGLPGIFCNFVASVLNMALKSRFGDTKLFFFSFAKYKHRKDGKQPKWDVTLCESDGERERNEMQVGKNLCLYKMFVSVD